jgi:HEPN domain-containing protein/predicted nucleotidyltransferase
MIQRAELPDGEPNAIAERIVSAIHPWRIVLFGSRARGDATDQSDYDIYVEVDEPRERLKELRGVIGDLFRDAGLWVDIKVQPRGEIERRRDDPGTLEWDVAREGRVLYANDAAPRVLAPPSRVREPSADPPESVFEWLELGERDLRAAGRLRDLDEDYWALVCNLCQQAVEKFMKALLVSRHVRPVRAHNLTELLAALRAAGCSLAGIDDDCLLLTAHAVAPRYAAGLALGEEDATKAFAAAERVVAAIRSHLPPRVH